ncbi:MAG: DUF4292 domain-containing protein [Prevotellaceae bacterium]|jgi:hypothetical protein|nr:DUF4292 domain-containing protein [Prevotellaceae bacterium]
MKNINYKLLFVICLAIFSGCKSKEILTVAPPSVVQTSNDHINQVLQAQPSFITANATKLRMDITLNNKQFASDGACKIYRDSVIQLSIQPFMGIELLRLELTPEAVYLFDKTGSNKYYHLVYEQLTDFTGVPLTFYDFQALICNQLFALGSKNSEDLNKITAEYSNKSLILNYKTNNILQVTNFSGKAIKKVEITDENRTFNFAADYSDFEKTDDVVAPKVINIKFKSKKNTVSLNFGINKIEFNKSMRIMLTNPLRYKATEWDALPDNPLF